jgi:glycine hydroxymethyltransferase
MAGPEAPRDRFDQLRALAEQHDVWRGRETLNLNAANGVLSDTARRMLSTRVADKGISGGLGTRHHMGGRLIDAAESIVVDLAQALFGASGVEYRPASGSLANALALAALTSPQDTLMVLNAGAPGHQSYRLDGWGGRLAQRVVDLPFDAETLDVDVGQLAEAAARYRPRLIVLGSAITLFPYTLAPVRQVADDIGALVMYDGAHAMGLFAGGVFQDPLREGADLITGSTQKTLPGPIGGLILTRSSTLDHQIFEVGTRLISNYENNRVLALGIALSEMAEFGQAYARACVANAQTLATALAEAGFHPLGEGRGYTRTNQVLLDVRPGPCPADALAERWERANIIVPALQLPSSAARAGLAANGIRIGVQEVTRLGMGPAEMRHIADLMQRAADGDDPAILKHHATDLARAYPNVYYSFEHGLPPEPVL